MPPDADITIPIEERAIGGLGIFWYEALWMKFHTNAWTVKNRLTMKKYIELDNLQRLSHHPFRFFPKQRYAIATRNQENAKCNATAATGICKHNGTPAARISTTDGPVKK